MGHKSYRGKRREPFTFDIDGEPTPPFRTRGGLGSVMLELGELAGLGEMEAASPEALNAIALLFQKVLGPKEYERFREFVANNDVDPETMLEILSDMYGAVLEGHPLVAPSASSPGPETTPRTYKVISPSDGTVTEVPLTPEREAAMLAAMEADMQETPGGS